MTLCGLLEWILGTTFSAVVFSVFGTFWLAWAATLSPSFAAFSSYAGPGAESPAEGLATRGFNASLGECRLPPPPPSSTPFPAPFSLEHKGTEKSRREKAFYGYVVS